MSAVRHLTITEQELARAEPLPQDTVFSFLFRQGWQFRVPTICVVNGEPVLRADWPSTPIHANDNVVFLSRPFGGNAETRKTFGLVAMLALAVIAPWAGGAIASTLGLGALAGQAIGAGIALLGSLAINALIGPKPGGADGQATDLYSISAQGNVGRLFEPVPAGFGRVKSFPDWAATPWADFVGNDQYLNVQLVLGIGRYRLEQIYVDDTKLWDYTTGFSSQFSGVQIQHCGPGEPVTLFPKNVVSSASVGGQQLTTTWTGPYAVTAPDSVAKTIAIDVAFANGCFRVGSNNSIETASAMIIVEARPINAAGAPIGSFSQIAQRTFSYATRTPQRATITVDVSPVRYEVRVRRTDAPLTGTAGANDILWAGMRAYIDGPATYPVSVLAIRIKATNQLTQQNAKKFGVVKTRIIPAWNGTAFVEQPTRNPAWAFLDLLTNAAYGEGNSGPLIAPNKIDYQAIVSLGQLCDANGITFDHDFRSAMLATEGLDTVLKVARARHRYIGDTITLVRDQYKPVPEMMLTDRDIVRGSVQLRIDMPDATQADSVIVEYVDEETWSPADVQYPPNSATFTAKNPKRLRCDGIVKRQNAYREAAFWYLQALYRRRTLLLETEHDGRLLAFGSPVLVQSELPQSYGAAASITGRDGLLLSLGNPVDWSQTGQAYVRFRTVTGRVFGPIRCARGGADDKILLDGTDLAAVEASTGKTLDSILMRQIGADDPTCAIGIGVSQPRLCIVKSGRPNGHKVALELFVDDPRVHDPVAEQMPVRPDVPPLALPEVPAITGLVASFGQGIAEPTLRVSWFPARGAVSYIAQVSHDGGTSWITIYEGADPQFQATVTLSALRLRVQGRGNAIAGAWTAIDLAAPTIVVAPGTVAPSSLQGGLSDHVMRELTTRIDQVERALQRVAELAGEQDAANVIDKKNIREEISARAGRLSAAINEVRTVAVSVNEAIAQLSTSVSASISGINARVTEQFNAIADINGKLAASWGVTVDVNGHVSGLKLLSDGTASGFVISADVLKLVSSSINGGTPFTAFEVMTVNNAARMTLNGSIAARSIMVDELGAVSSKMGHVWVGNSIELDGAQDRVVVWGP